MMCRSETISETEQVFVMPRREMGGGGGVGDSA